MVAVLSQCDINSLVLPLSVLLSEIQIYLGILPSFQGFIGTGVVLDEFMEGSVHPLNKLKVVLEFGFHQFLDLSESQFLYLNELLDMEELETCLQDFEIV